MNEKIKEILEGIQVVITHDGTIEFNTKELKTLIDYITNLQQYYNDNVNKYEELLVKYSNLQENQKLNELNVCVGCNNNPDYKLRCEKAIEYIRNNIADIEFIKKRYRVIIDDYVETTINDIEKLLNILRGGDKE